MTEFITADQEKGIFAENTDIMSRTQLLEYISVLEDRAELLREIGHELKSDEDCPVGRLMLFDLWEKPEHHEIYRLFRKEYIWNMDEDEYSGHGLWKQDKLAKFQALWRGHSIRWKVPCFGFRD